MATKMKRLFRSTYYRKIQLSFILLILLPIVTVTVISYTINRNASMENIELSNRSILQMMEKDINETISDLAYASLIFVDNAMLKPYYKHYAELESIKNYDDYEIYSGIESLLNLVSFKASPNHIHLFITNEKGLIISTPGFFSRGKSIEQLQDHWGQIKAKEQFTNSSHFQWLGSVSSDKYPERYFYGTRVIQENGTGRVLAVLNIGISEKYFKELFDPIKSGKFALFDSNGERFAGSADVSLTASKDDNAKIRSKSSISIVDWDIVFETSKADVVGSMTRTFFFSGIIIAVSMVLFLLLSLILARRLHRPIHKLQRIAVLFGGGNRSMRFAVSGNDEVNELGQAVNEMLDQIEELISDINQEQDIKRRMELHALANQIRPHFLLNTLNAIKISLIMGADSIHAEKINSLMSLLRNYMRMDEHSLLKEECEVLRHYVNLMEMRSDMRIELDMDYTEEAGDCYMPKLLLQPIVENAIVHGFMERERDAISKIRVRGEIKSGKLIIAIEDNGIGMTEPQISEMNAKLEAVGATDQRDADHIGLRNILQRMKLIYGESASMNIESNAGEGITVYMYIPILAQDFTLGGDRHV